MNGLLFLYGTKWLTVSIIKALSSHFHSSIFSSYQNMVGFAPPNPTPLHQRSSDSHRGRSSYIFPPIIIWGSPFVWQSSILIGGIYKPLCHTGGSEILQHRRSTLEEMSENTGKRGRVYSQTGQRKEPLKIQKTEKKWSMTSSLSADILVDLTF